MAPLVERREAQRPRVGSRKPDAPRRVRLRCGD